MSDRLTIRSRATARLFLRPLSPADANRIAAMTNHPAITDVVDILPTPFTPDDAERLITGRPDGRDVFVGLWHGDDRALIGLVGLHRRERSEIEIGYWITPTRQGQGFASEAVAAVIETLRDEDSVVVFAECRPDNKASWALLTKLGFRSSGTSGHRPGRLRLVLAIDAEPML